MDEDKVIVVKDSGTSGWLIGLLVLVVLVVGAIIALPYLKTDAAKDNAIAEAAQDVGNAANEVGNAARDLSDDR